MRQQRQIRAILDGLDYDFNSFEIDEFIRHVERHHRREILVNGLPLELELSAVLVRAESADYIFYNRNLHPVQQVHSILHEIAHIVLKHPGRSLHEVLSPELLAQLKSPAATGHLRMADIQLRETSEEKEAEAFVMLIQERLVMARRLEKLMGPSSSIRAFRPWVDGVWKIG